MKIRNIFKKGSARMKGGVEGIAHGVVFGWALNDSKQAANLRFEVDGVTVGHTVTAIMRNDIAAAFHVTHACGFRFDLKPHLNSLDGKVLEIFDDESNRKLSTTPVSLNQSSGWGLVDGIHGIEVSGWAVSERLEAGVTEVEILIDGQVAGTTTTTVSRPDLYKIGIPANGFTFAVPPVWHDGEVHTLKARVVGSTRELRGGEFKFSAEIECYIDSFSDTGVSGWICNLKSPNVPVAFDFWVNDECVAKNITPLSARFDVEQHHFTGKPVGHPMGFSITFSESVKLDEKFNSLKLCLRGTSVSILKKDVVTVSRLDVLERMEGLMSEFVKNSTGLITEDLNEAVDNVLLTSFMPQVLQQIRAGSFQKPILVQANKPAKLSNPTGIVDVIIPVYKGYSETLECIRSVLATRGECPMELIVLNDFSPDPKLTHELKRLAAIEKFTLIENTKNLGFVATVNKGMKLHEDRDVVLLNSDTLVPKGWLKGLQKAANSAINIATVTPMSNRATIFSIPRTCVDNDMPLGKSVEQMHALCAEKNPDMVVDVPTGVGFSMYIKRLTLDRVGFFDEERWAKGYCEENDFCVRATSAGWRNVAACDVFVQHHGSVSFDTEKEPRVKENLVKLNALYPDYAMRVDQYLKNDPLALPRSRINMALLKQVAPAFILFVTHGRGGGTDTAINNLVKKHQAKGKHVLILQSTKSGNFTLSPASTGSEKNIITDYPYAYPVDLLAGQLAELNISYIHFHHSIGFNSAVWQLPDLLNVQYEVMLHDFYTICPRINMIDDSGVFCGQPAVSVCERCVKNGTELDPAAQMNLIEVGGTVALWRKFNSERLDDAREVVAPSQNAQQHLLKDLNVHRIDVVPHPEPAVTFQQRPGYDGRQHRIAVLGAIGPHKGSKLLLECARIAQRNELPIHFVVIGFTDDDEKFAELSNVEITGKYVSDDLATIVESCGCTTALFLSVWPETFSYTLSEAWRVGLYPIAMDIGAPAERIREMGIGSVIPFSSNPKAIVDSLIVELESVGINS